MGITIREIVEGIAILATMVAVIVIPNPAGADRTGDFQPAQDEQRSERFQLPYFDSVRSESRFSNQEKIRCQ